MAKRHQLQGIIPDKLYYKIGEVSRIAGVEPYVLRYWESEFKEIKPERTQSRQRLYRRKDVELILEIKKMLYEEKLTIAGVRQRLQEWSGRGKKQLQFDFCKKDQKSILAEIKQELMAIREMLR